MRAGVNRPPEHRRRHRRLRKRSRRRRQSTSGARLATANAARRRCLPAHRARRPLCGRSPNRRSRSGRFASDRAREIEFSLRARRTLAQTIPRSAARTQTEITRVLWTAANAYDPAQERAVADAAQAVWARDDVSPYVPLAEASEARRLNDEAIRAYWYRRNVAEAFELQMKAFGANPYDPEVAGNLAFLHLRVSIRRSPRWRGSSRCTPSPYADRNTLRGGSRTGTPTPSPVP